MRFGKFGAIVAIAAASMVSMSAQLTPSPQQLLAVDRRERAPKPARKRQRIGLAEGTPKFRRNRGAPAKPKKHPNMRHVSKRVRRKHRRARG